jgi:hypothetical protein
MTRIARRGDVVIRGCASGFLWDEFKIQIIKQFRELDWND